MQRKTLTNLCFLLVTLLIFVAGCAPKLGTLEVKSDPSGAKVRIDGKDAGVTPYSKELSPSYLQGKNILSQFPQKVIIPKAKKLQSNRKGRKSYRSF